MAIDFSKFCRVAPVIVTGKHTYPVMLRARHGVGKSTVVYAIADSLAWDPKARAVVLRAGTDLPPYRVIERRASQMTEGELTGLPENAGDRTKWNPPDWFKEACEEPVVLFLDELDRGVAEVRQGFFELADSRKIYGNTLHAGTVIFAACNSGEDGSQYTVNEMDPAELDRWTVFDIDPTVEDWLLWAKDHVDRVVWDFINHNHDHLEHRGEFEPNKVYPSRRSWDRFSQKATAAGVLEDPNANTELIFALALGFVGVEAALSFVDFCKNYERQVTVADILDRGDFAKVKDFGVNEHTAMVGKMDASKAFEVVLTETQVKNLAEYFMLLPSEAAMVLWTAIGKATDQKVSEQNVIALHKSKTQRGRLVDYLVEILTGKAAEDKAA